MSPFAAVLRAGLSRGLIELRQSFTNGPDLVSHFLWPGLMVAAMFFLRDLPYAGGGLLLGTLALPGILGMNAATGLIAMSQQLTADREDGTLLRARATPHGMPAYLIGKVISVSGGLLADLVIFLVPAVLIVRGLSAGPDAWPTLAWVLGLGLVATLPLGAVLGSAFSGARGQGVVQLLFLAVIGISGIFYPITALPGWLQWAAQLFPVYWMGLGTRSALLPDAAAAIEIGGSWRHLETAGVLGAWAVLGLLVAPAVLRRMARRESGSAVEARRERALQRVG
ncbi:ABC transporter permease [Bailinhaonella thermotolerans]|uniref:ABC transporter permease n=1 Tax=Bailinhaonella thermotolerans TaxID=1070861 RepID=A0A3A4BD17_9ACTN|nr:ABC transporter permease [Bailinhaonella thermotolerans]RJL35996.1 ABC transporter permease [Bailinhaonella thermotolerans]